MRLFAGGAILFHTMNGYCAGGPNFIEGTGLYSLWVAPLIGSVIVFVILLVSGSKRVAFWVTGFTFLFVGLLATSGGTPLLGVILFGPWVLFIVLAVTLVAEIALTLATSAPPTKANGDAEDSPHGLYTSSGELLTLDQAIVALRGFDRGSCDDLLERFGHSASADHEHIDQVRGRCFEALKNANSYSKG